VHQLPQPKHHFYHFILQIAFGKIALKIAELAVFTFITEVCRRGLISQKNNLFLYRVLKHMQIHFQVCLNLLLEG